MLLRFIFFILVFFPMAASAYVPVRIHLENGLVLKGGNGINWAVVPTFRQLRAPASLGEQLVRSLSLETDVKVESVDIWPYSINVTLLVREDGRRSQREIQFDSLAAYNAYFTDPELQIVTTELLMNIDVKESDPRAFLFYSRNFDNKLAQLNRDFPDLVGGTKAVYLADDGQVIMRIGLVPQDYDGEIGFMFDEVVRHEDLLIGRLPGLILDQNCQTTLQ